MINERLFRGEDFLAKINNIDLDNSIILDIYKSLNIPYQIISFLGGEKYVKMELSDLIENKKWNSADVISFYIKSKSIGNYFLCVPGVFHCLFYCIISKTAGST